MRRRMRRWPFVLAVVIWILLVVGWELSRGKSNQKLQGLYVMAQNRSDFYPDASRCPPHGPRYWIDPTADSGLRNSLVTIPAGPTGTYRTVYISIVGDVSPLGRNGYRGRYWRELRITRLLEVKNVPGCQ